MERRLKCGVARLHEINAAPCFPGINGTAGNGEAGDLRKICCDVVENSAGVQVAEEPYATAKDRLFTERAPGKPRAWLKYHLLHIAQDAALACRNHLVERNGNIMRELLERYRGYGDAIGLAYAAGIAIRADGQGQLQLMIDSDFILEVEAKAVDRQRLR